MIKEEIKEIEAYLTEPKHVKIIKIIAILIPIIIVSYLITYNFLIDQEFNNHYNIGGEENYLTPLSRISEKYDNQRDLIDGLVYFEIKVPRNSETITIKTRLKQSRYRNEKISLGAKNQEAWHYKYNLIYNPKVDLTGYKTNQDLTNKTNIIIATDQDLKLIPNYPENYKDEQTTIATTLRGRHTFYFYTEKKIEIEVKKQDINWYEGEDSLTITIYDINNNEIINTTIEDDGITNISKEPAIVQEIQLTANLSEGIYKLEFSEFDGLIKEIKINTNKIITKRLFLADNELYNQETKETSIYTESKNLKFLTYHDEGIQNITYDNNTFEVQRDDETFELTLNQPTTLIFPSNDIIVEATSYLALNKENYFNPFTQIITSLENYEQADYIVTDYKQPIRDGEWIITETTFNIEDLYIKDNKLSLLFNTPHLSKEEYKNYTIPIDYINITIYKPGLL
jgi:hypothetical protein